MIHIYYGTGKGKSTAAAGLAARAAGSGMSVWLTHFIKAGNEISGEDTFLANAEVDVTVFEGQQHPMFLAKGKFDKEKVIKLVENALLDIEHAIATEKYDLIVMDEVLNALNAGLLTAERLLDLLEVASNIELVLTGRKCNNIILNRADYVSEINEIKHPYKKGVLARRGIEY